MRRNRARRISLFSEKPECPIGGAEKIVFELIKEVPGVRDLLRTDVEAAYAGDPSSTSFDEIIVGYPCIEAIAIQRIAHILYRKQLPLGERSFQMPKAAFSRKGESGIQALKIGALGLKILFLRVQARIFSDRAQPAPHPEF